MRNLARAIGAACVVALLVVAAGAVRHTSSKPAGDAARADAKLERLSGARDYYRNLAEPVLAPEVSDDTVLATSVAAGSGHRGAKAIASGAGDKLAAWQENARKNRHGFPPAAKQLAKLEADAVKTGKNPRQLKKAKTAVGQAAHPAGGVRRQGQRRLLRFLPPGERDTARTRPSASPSRPDKLLSGPLHNKIVDPAKLSHKDNNSFWVATSAPTTSTRCSTARRASPSASAPT